MLLVSTGAVFFLLVVALQSEGHGVLAVLAVLVDLVRGTVSGSSQARLKLLQGGGGDGGCRVLVRGNGTARFSYMAASAALLSLFSVMMALAGMPVKLWLQHEGGGVGLETLFVFECAELENDLFVFFGRI